SRPRRREFRDGKHSKRWPNGHSSAERWNCSAAMRRNCGSSTLQRQAAATAGRGSETMRQWQPWGWRESRIAGVERPQFMRTCTDVMAALLVASLDDSNQGFDDMLRSLSGLANMMKQAQE